MFRDRGLSEELIRRCREAGYVALCLTVDTPVAGNRERDFVYGFSAQPRSRLRQVASFLRHPLWLKRALVDKDLEMVNLTRSETLSGALPSDIRSYIPPYPTMTEIGKRAATAYSAPMTRKRWGRRIIGVLRMFG